MVKTIIFDESNVNWVNNYKINRLSIEQYTRVLYDRLRLKGYVYLDRIYDTFGANWNPEEPNDCIRYGVNQFVLSETHLNDNRFEINIYYQDIL